MRAVSRDEGVEVHDLRLHDLLAAEGEELAHEARGPLGGAHDVLHLARGAGRSASRLRRSSSPCPMITMSRLLKSWAMPPGEPAHRLHLLRLAELLLEAAPLLLGLAPLRDVQEHHRHHPRRGLEGVDLVDAAEAVVAVR